MQIEIGKKGKMNNAMNDRQQQPYQHQCQRKKNTHSKKTIRMKRQSSNKYVL